MENQPLIVIVGPTASGKSGLAIDIAKAYGGEIISVDSRAIYTGMNIGAAKPTMIERQAIPHWGFDLVLPGERFTAADFKQYATQKIAEIRTRGHVPIIAGGTGLYIDALMFDYQFPTEPPFDKRKKFETMSLEELHGYCARHNIMLPENILNKRYVINAIVRNGHALKRNVEPIAGTIVVGIATPTDVLRSRIGERIEQIFANGVIAETQMLSEKYGLGSEAMKANIYPIIQRHMQGELTLDEAKKLANVKDWHLAKRQLTWFRRNEYIKWFPLDQAYTYLAQSLDNMNNL